MGFINQVITTGWGPSSLAELVNITTITIMYDTQISIFRWGYKQTYNWRAPSCSDMYIYINDIISVYWKLQYTCIEMVNIPVHIYIYQW